MKGLVFFGTLCLLKVLCDCQNYYQDAEDQIVHYVSVHGNKGYHFQYKTKNGIERQETGKVDDQDNLEVHGNYAYISPEGLKIENNYEAGKNGFRPRLRFIPSDQPNFKNTAVINTSKQVTTPPSKVNNTALPTTTPVPSITNRFPESSEVPQMGVLEIGASVYATLAGGGLG